MRVSIIRIPSDTRRWLVISVPSSHSSAICWTERNDAHLQCTRRACGHSLSPLSTAAHWRNAATTTCMARTVNSRQRRHLLHCTVSQWNLSVLSHATQLISAGLSTMILHVAPCRLSVIFLTSVLSLVSAVDSKYNTFVERRPLLH